jgi:TATA-binding protein-associated factor Taf7
MSLNKRMDKENDIFTQWSITQPLYNLKKKKRKKFSRKWMELEKKNPE